MNRKWHSMRADSHEGAAFRPFFFASPTRVPGAWPWRMLTGATIRLGIFLLAAGVVMAGDWPMVRHDARRSGCTTAGLPATLKPSWRVRLPEFEPAFPYEPREQFDLSYEPVCAGGLLVIGSPHDGSVRAWSVKDGSPRWTVYTEGPVRLAPVLSGGRVYVGSDDGIFRCLDLTTGELQWQVKARAPDRPDMHVLGNNRLISLWPIRGGPVVVDDTVYFGSGVWPTLGVAVFAVDKLTGRPTWINREISFLDKVRIDHNELKDAGAAPHGYLAATEERLVIANGRSQPLGLNRSDGSLYRFVQGYRRGDCHLALGGRYIFVGRDGVLTLEDFLEVGGYKWVRAGKDAPQHFDGAKFDQFEGPYFSYKHFPGCDAESVFEDGIAYGFVHGVVFAHDLNKAAVSEEEKVHGSRTLHPFRWDAPLLFRAVTGLRGSCRLFCKAGKVLYGRAGNAVVALALTGKTPPVRVLWSVDVGEPATSMIAAEDRLFVVTGSGSVICLAGDGKLRLDTPPEKASITAAPRPSPELKSVLAASRQHEGFLVVLGHLDAGEVDAVLEQTRLRLLLVCADGAAVTALRQRYGTTDFYGKRLEVFRGDPATFHLPPYLGSIVWRRLGPGDATPKPEAMHRLWTMVRPYGGTLCLTGGRLPEMRRTLQRITLPGAKFVDSTGCVAVLRPDGPQGASDWTHETADPARSFFSRDTAVTLPLAPIWFGDGPDYGFFKRKDYGRGVKPQVVEGRVFALQQFSRTLFAYDAYTGRHLWQQRDNGKVKGFITRFVSRPEGIYAAGKGICVIYDPATGKELSRIDYAAVTNDKSAARAAGIVVDDTSILLAVSDFDTVAIEKGLWDARRLLCFDRISHALRWTKEAEHRFNIKAMAMGDGLVFCTDSPSPVVAERGRRRGQAPSEAESVVYALEETSGRERWRVHFRAPFHAYGADHWLGVRTYGDWLGYASAMHALLAGRERRTLLIDVRDGSTLWDKKRGMIQPVVIMGKQAMDQGGRIFDLRNGEVIKSGLFQRGGCNYAVANPKLILLRDRTVCLVDLASGEQHRLRNIRSGCSNSIVAASGILNIPNFSQACVCNYPVQTSSAWVHTPGVAGWGGKPVALAAMEAKAELPVISPEQAEAMHQFKRAYYIDDPKQAAAHLLGAWNFDTTIPGKPDRIPGIPGTRIPCRLTHPSFVPRGTGRALQCRGEAEKTTGSAMLGPPGTLSEAVTLCARVRLGKEQHKGVCGIVERVQFIRLTVPQTKPPYSITFTVQLEDKTWHSVTTPRIIQPGAWLHVAGSYDGEAGELAVYLNGKRVGKSDGIPGRIGRVSAIIAIGSRDGSAYLNGDIDDVRIYDRALGPTVITTLAK